MTTTIAVATAATRGRLLGVHNEGHNKSVETQYFSEDKDEDHADVEPGLLGGSAYARVADDSDSKSRR